MKRMTLSEYLAVPENYRGVWTTERWDIPDWENLRKSHMGKRTLMYGHENEMYKVGMIG